MLAGSGRFWFNPAYSGLFAAVLAYSGRQHLTGAAVLTLPIMDHSGLFCNISGYADAYLFRY